MNRRGPATVLFLLLGPWWLTTAPGRAADPIRFNRDIRPILSRNCLACHGPDPGSRKAGLRLDREETAFSPARSGKTPIVRGNPDGSILVQRILSGDPDERMPPPDSRKELSESEKATIVRWVKEGAPYEEHWAFLPPVRPPVPANGHASAIDAFIAEGLKRAGLDFMPEAERSALIRRAALDLTGLPPAPDDVHAFLDDASAGAWERAVDRLLASPSYGEERARRWLDIARYADTQGLHHDDYREIWPYRDWVVQAFNDDMPFDELSTEQLAGDLMPGAGDSQLIATGYLRSNVSTAEGGVIPEEVAANVAKDRIEAFSLGWLGLTVQCAQCHDHKLDPVSTRDFYQLAAMFRNGEDVPVEPAHQSRVEPTLPVLSSEDRARLDELHARIDRATRAIDAAVAEASADPAALEAKARAVEAGIDASSQPVLSIPLDEASLAASERVGDVSIAETPDGKALVVKGEGSLAFQSAAGRFDGHQPHAVELRVKVPADSNGAVISCMEPGRSYLGWDLLLDKGRLSAHLVANWPDDAIKVISRERIPADTWVTIEATYDGSGLAEGLRLWLDGRALEVKVDRPRLTGSAAASAPLRIGSRGPESTLRDYSVRAVELWSGGAALQRERRHSLAASLRQPPDAANRTAEIARALLGAIDDRYRSLLAEIDAARRAEGEVMARVPRTRIVREKPGRATARILKRGQYDQPGDEVEADVPHILPRIPDGAPRNRLGLARWLFRPDHPLTARVLANRLWQDFMGTGIVATSWDFGALGEAPSHPELLDWLAVDLRESGWDVKRTIRLIVTSATYRQSARTPPGARERDPGNRLLSRGPRHRLDGEVVRDLALCASDLLVRTIGGPPVKPYQPPNVWEAVAMFDSTTRFYTPDTGASLYRRSLYTFVKRAALHPAMDAFNAPSREVCTIRRERANTPLQALVLWNDPQLVEAERRLAENALRSTSDRAARLDFMAERLLARKLKDAEREAILPALDELLEHYRSRPADAGQLISTGESRPDPSLAASELAAWTLAASQLLCLDATIND